MTDSTTARWTPQLNSKCRTMMKLRRIHLTLRSRMQTPPKEPDALRPTIEEPTPTQDPIIKQEPTTEDNNDLTPHTATGPTETPPVPRRRISREVEKLKSNLDGPSWECKGTHGRRSLRVTKTGLETGPDYQGTWDNVIKIEDIKTPQENWIVDINECYTPKPPIMHYLKYLYMPPIRLSNVPITTIISLYYQFSPRAYN